MPETSMFKFMSLSEVGGCLENIHQQTCTKRGRIEIRNGDHVCVLISKEELDALEAALEILSNTAEVRSMARTIAALTHEIAVGPLVAAGD